MEEYTVYKILAKNVKRYREKAHITQEKLAEMTGLSLDYIGKIEVCINKPGLRAVIKISNSLNVPIKNLFE